MRARLLAAAGALILTGCFPAATGTPGGSTAPEPVQLSVFAASSLADAFGEIEADFEFLHEGVDVIATFGPSGDLAAQIEGGADADVFASAGPIYMEDVRENPGVLDSGDFAENSLSIATPLDDPGDVSSLEDLARPGLRVAIAAQGVPAGDDAREMLVNAGLLVEVLPNIVEPNEVDDAAVVTRVEQGGVDAGIVYVSDVSEAAGHDLRPVSIDGDVNVTATYSIAVLTTTPQEDLARRFMAYVRGPEGQATLDAYGFEALFLG
jgi:molybdate transport system substrate-binding protein